MGYSLPPGRGRAVAVGGQTRPMLGKGGGMENMGRTPGHAANLDGIVRALREDRGSYIQSIAVIMRLFSTHKMRSKYARGLKDRPPRLAGER